MKTSITLKPVWKAVTVALLVALLSSCALIPTEPVVEEPLVVEFNTWWGDYTILIAQEQGLFEKYGVKVKPVLYENFYRALPDLASGQIDAGLFAIGDALNVARHTNLKAVAVYDNGSLNTVAAIPTITKIADLEGKRIGVPIGSTYELLIGEMLKSAEMTTADVTLVNVNPEDVPTSLGKTIDAGFVYEPHASEAVAKGNHLLLNSTQFIGLFPDVIVFRAEVVKNREKEIRAFLKAWFEAVEFRNQHPEEARQIIADYFKVPVSEIEPDDNLVILTREDNVPLFNKESGNNRSLFATSRLQSDFLVRIGVLSTLPDLDQLLDPTYLP